MKIPTDLEILSDIYDNNYNKFCNYSESKKDRHTKIYVPVNLFDVAYRLKVDEDIVFGRLHYHLEQKYSYRKSDETMVHFFLPKLNNFCDDRHVVNFPLLSSVLAGLKKENNRSNRTFFLGIIALSASIAIFILKEC